MHHIVIHAHKNATRLLAVLLLTLAAQVSLAANHHVLFNNHQVHVFPDSCISGMTTTDTRITFTALDGKEYTYSRSTVKSVSTYVPKSLPQITSFMFDKKCNYQLVADAPGDINRLEIRSNVIGIGRHLAATFELSDSDAHVVVDDVELTSGVSRVHYDQDKIFTACYDGDLILSPTSEGKYEMKPYGRQYRVIVYFLTGHSTTVPRIDINTVGHKDITSKDYYLDAEIIIDGAGVFPSMTDSVQIKGRGNSSWSPDPTTKNPYRLKFASKVKPLGLTKGKNWVLLANKIPGSMLTNAIGMKAASLMGLPAVNHMIPVDLYINGTYKGSYNLTEKVGLSNNSVDLPDETAATLIELDRYFDEVEGQKFRSNTYNLPVNIKEPTFAEGGTVLTLDQISEHFNAWLDSLASGGDISQLVDTEMLARYLMHNEYICNYELFHPKSTYIYNENLLDAGSKYIFGPAWDLDYGFGFETDENYFYTDPEVDYSTRVEFALQQFGTDLLQHPQVKRHMYGLWKEFVQNSLDELCEFCVEYQLYASPSLIKDQTVNEDRTNYNLQAQRAASWLRHRANYLLEYYKRYHVVLGDVNGDDYVSISDLTALIDYLLSSAPVGVNIDNADVDQDGHVSIADATTLIDRLLSR